MAKANFKLVDAYIAKQPREAQPILRRVREILRKAMPEAEEGISYQIPAYRLHGGVALFFAGWKQHFSLYPTTAPLVAAFGDELAPYELSKGTIRFPYSQPVPAKLIARIAKFRATEAGERAKAKAAAKKKTKRPLKKKAAAKRG